MNLDSINIARKLAWSFNRLTGIEYTELFGEACLGYAEALKDFDPSKDTQFSSFAWIYIRNRLRVYVKREMKYAKQINFSTLFADNEECINNLFFTHDERQTYEELLQYMSTDAKEIAELIIQKKQELPTDIPPYWIRRTIRDMLRERGWSWPRIWEGIRALKKALNHVCALFIM
jgi:DNA-directed RNA polymerase specialized sigma subunit